MINQNNCTLKVDATVKWTEDQEGTQMTNLNG